MFKEKGLLCQRVNYQLPALSNETDANLSQTSGEKNGIKTVLLQSKHCPVCPDILCLLSQERPCPGLHLGLIITAGDTQGCSPHWQCHPSKGDKGVIAISWTPHSLHRETPLILSLVNPGLCWTVQASGSGAAGACCSQVWHQLLGLLW